MPVPAAETKALPQPDVLAELADIRKTLADHSNQIAEIKEVLSRKRKPTSNARVKIKDKRTGKVYQSKNSCYKSLLKAGELSDLAKRGVFGDDPEHNTTACSRNIWQRYPIKPIVPDITHL